MFLCFTYLTTLELFLHYTFLYYTYPLTLQIWFCIISNNLNPWGFQFDQQKSLTFNSPFPKY